jgi:hypothetical protein
MSKLVWFLGANLGGWLGWWLGSFGGFFPAFLLSLVGTALGIYWARRFAAEHF